MSITQNDIYKKVKGFQKNNPEIAAAMETLDFAMSEYQRAINSLSTSKIYASNSTNVIK